MIELDILKITGDIDNDTPKCVLKEMCKINSIKFNPENNSPDYINRIIYKIYSSKIICVSENYEDNFEELRLIARFINIENIKWEKKTLCKAFRFLLKFENEDYCKKQRFHFETGPQTPFSPKSLNACVLYKICQVNLVNTSFFSTVEEMASNIKLIFLLKCEYIYNHLISNCIKLTIYENLRFQSQPETLVNILNFMSPNASQDIITDSILDRIITKPISPKSAFDDSESHSYNYYDSTIYNYENFSQTANEILDLEENRNPKTHIEAIVMAALYYKIDITKCEDPLAEYDVLLNHPYFPHDENLKRRIRSATLFPDSLQNPYIDKIFNPNFPINMYSPSDLREMCEDEGIDVRYDDSYFTSLQMAYLTESFVHGKQGVIQNETTTFLDNIEDLYYDEVVVYGIRTEQSMIAFTYGELNDTFSSYKRFINPNNNDLFTEDAINKLYILTQKEKIPTEKEEHFLERLDLGQTIERIRIYIKNNNVYIEDFLSLYEISDEQEQKKIENILTLVLHVGMFMRNWDGKSDYPLKVEDTNFLPEEQINVDHRVTQSLIELETACKEFDKVGQYMLNLPLMEYHKDSTEFLTVSEEREGLTIKDRISIVRGGEDYKDMSSCIRLSSNIFCATSYFYMVLIGFHLPFSIKEVSPIF